MVCIKVLIKNYRKAIIVETEETPEFQPEAVVYMIVSD